jgi:integrase
MGGEEIRDVWTALDAARMVDDVPDCCARLVRALLMTAVRRGELADATWPEVSYFEPRGSPRRRAHNSCIPNEG